MTFIERLDKLLKEKGVNKTTFLQDLNYSKNAYSEWKSGVTKSYMNKIDSIADYFGVSVDYLLCRTENPTVVDDEWLATPVALSAPEGYDALTEEGKKQIQELIKILPKNTQD